MKDYLNKKFKNKKILILGFGREGISTLKLLRQNFPDQEIALADKDEKEVDDKNIKKFFGKDYLKNLNDFDVIIKSPGVSALKDEIQEAIKKGIEVTSQTKIFFDIVQGVIIGITGTKGKSTTSSLIYEMLRAGRLNAELVGNIGSPVLDSLNQDSPDKYYVFELSSHQLFDLTKSPHIAVVTNVAVDHLDWYGKFETYVEAKANILKFQSDDDTAILNFDNLMTRGFDRYVQGKLYFTSKLTKQKGAYVEEGIIYLNIGGIPQILGETGELKLIGKHNWDNVMSAAIAAKVAGVKNSDIWKAATNFNQLPHHLELVKEVKGVKFYNDSFAVDQIATSAAINSFDGPLTLIMGGYERGIDYSVISDEIAGKANIKNIVVIGQIAEKIVKSLKKANYSGNIIKLGKTGMSKVVKKSFELSNHGEIVLLSPAAASFDMFKDYKDRGEQFKSAVNLLLSSSP